MWKRNGNQGETHEQKNDCLILEKTTAHRKQSRFQHKTYLSILYIIYKEISLTVCCEGDSVSGRRIKRYDYPFHSDQLEEFQPLWPL